MKIRPATEDDYNRVIEMYIDFIGEDRYSKHDNDSFKEVITSPTNYFYVAEVDGKLVGLASVSIRRVVRYPKPIAELDELYVDSNYRKHGIGKQLMERVETTAKQQDCYRLYIESQYKHSSAHKFYEDVGYKNYGYHFYKNL